MADYYVSKESCPKCGGAMRFGANAKWCATCSHEVEIASACSCRYSDRWRCAVDLHSPNVACKCPCHNKSNRTEPTEPTEREK